MGLAASLLPAVPPVEAATPRPLVSRPGQVKIVTINARQNAVLGIKRFEDMFELTRALRRRPPAFDGGFRGGVWAPDVMITVEMRPSNAEIFEHIMRQRFPHKFRLAGAEDASGQIIYNPDTLTLAGEVERWEDVCLADKSAGRRQGRFYQIARFVEKATGAQFVVASMHMPKSLPEPHCYTDNIEQLRTRLENDPGAVFIGGDFNRRAVELQSECDPEERSAMLPWYSMLVAPTDGGRVFQDAVVTHHRRLQRSLREQWTHEQKAESVACIGGSKIRRTRIDYLFASGATVADASADVPGWAGATRGTKHPENHKYSDHRFVQGRFVITGPRRPNAPTLARSRGGRIDVTWASVPGASGYIVYRAIGNRAFDELARVAPELTGFSDSFTEHGHLYRYAIAAIGPNGGQSHESNARRARADARGPQVVRVSPPNGATGVARLPLIDVTFDEDIAPKSVTGDRIELFKGRQRVAGQVVHIAPNVLRFRPAQRLKRFTVYTIRVRPVQDELGNVGSDNTSSFRVRRKP
jgi:hypothetical protein